MIGEVLAAAAERLGEGVLARIGGPIGEAARAAGRELAALDPDTRKRRRAAAMALARAPVPPGLRSVHRSWIEAGLEGLPARARESVASGGGDPIDVWLARWACAGLVPMPAIRPVQRPLRDLDDVLALEYPGPLDWVTEVGCDQLAFALHALKTEARGPFVRKYGPGLQQAFDRIEQAPRAGQLGPLRAVIARCAVEPQDGWAVLRIGARAIAPHAATRPLAARQLALRLFHVQGRILHEELVAHAGAPLDQAPSWAALADG